MFKRFINLIRSKFKYQLMVVLFCISIIPFLIIQCTTHFVTLNTMKSTVNSLANDQATKSKENINLLLKNYATLVGTLSSDYTLIEGLHTLEKASNYKTTEETLKMIEDKLYLSAFTSNEIASISIITSSGILIPYHRTNIKFDSSIYDSIHQEVSNTFQIKGGLLEPHTNTQNKSYIYVARRISNLESLQHLGTLIICIDPTVIQEACFNQEGMEYSYSFVLNNNGQVIAYPPNHFPNGIDNPQSFIEGKKHLLTYTRPLDYLDWQLLHVIDEAIITSDISKLAQISLLLTVSIALGLIFIIIKACSTFTKPIPVLIDAMKEVEGGNLDIQVPLTSQNEFLDIQKNFNYMIKSTQELLHHNAKQYEELLALTEQKKEAEIRALEAQINPHFLFNTLDSINWMAIEKNEYEISLMLRNLALILRYTISNSNEMVPLKSEVDWLHQYLYLQQQRFVGVFDYTIKIDKQLFFYKIHKLLLQPLIENALLHGFEGMNHGGHLDISFDLIEDKFIVIKISDNGCGISEEKKQYINNLLISSSTQKSGRSIGVSNVIFRLHSYYEHCGKLQFCSSEKGTTFILHIPILS